jgi:hypothetical protein
MDPLTKVTDVKSDQQSLSNFQLEEFCKQHSLPYQYIELKELVDNKTAEFPQSFVHTGIRKNDINNGNDNHWLYFVAPNRIFDSYGKANDNYHLHNDFEVLPNEQLQNFDTVVCGEYCLSFNWYLNKEYLKENELVDNKSYAELVKKYIKHFNFTKNEKENDNIVREWYNRMLSNKK